MSMVAREDRVPEIKRALNDPRHVCSVLDLLRGSKKQATGLIICCPKHGEKNASCSVTVADGTIRVRCFGCDLAGDVLHLIAAARNLDIRSDFPAVLEEATRIAGITFDAPEPVRAKTVTEKKDYPLPSEVASLWQRAVAVTDHGPTTDWLVSRGLDPQRLAELDLVRAIPDGARLPWWASYKGDAGEARTWEETGHRLLFPVYDPLGQRRSVRVGRVIDDGNTTPKRLPPAGRLSAGLVLANKLALAVIGHGARYDILVVEGEPDFLTWAAEPIAVFGVGSGWWTRALANRIPSGTKVVIRTHQDEAGDRYAAEVGRTLVRRCKLFRPARGGHGDENDRLRAGELAASFDEGAEPFVIETVDPTSFFLGRLFAQYAWLGDELKPGVFAARCPGESLHKWGERFDGSSVVRAPERPTSDGVFRCAHPPCRDGYDRHDVLANSINRTAAKEGL